LQSESPSKTDKRLPKTREEGSSVVLGAYETSPPEFCLIGTIARWNNCDNRKQKLGDDAFRCSQFSCSFVAVAKQITCLRVLLKSHIALKCNALLSIRFSNTLGLRRGPDNFLAFPTYFPICSTTKRIFLEWVKEVRTTKS
jgi:hypothetical protein